MTTDVIETKIAFKDKTDPDAPYAFDQEIVHTVVATCPDPKYAAICASALQERGVDVFYSIRETPKPQKTADACASAPIKNAVPMTRYDVLRAEVEACTESATIAWETVVAKLHIALRNAAGVKEPAIPKVESGASAMAESLHRSQSPVMRRVSGVAYADGWEGAIWDVAHRLGISTWLRRALDELPPYGDVAEV